MATNNLYKDNKEAPCGSICVCPVCGSSFEKIQYSQAFCRKSCKDAYWNSKGDRHDKNYYAEYNASRQGNPPSSIISKKLRQAVNLCKHYGFKFDGSEDNWADVVSYLNAHLQETRDKYNEEAFWGHFAKVPVPPHSLIDPYLTGQIQANELFFN